MQTIKAFNCESCNNSGFVLKISFDGYEVAEPCCECRKGFNILKNWDKKVENAVKNRSKVEYYISK